MTQSPAPMLAQLHLALGAVDDPAEVIVRRMSDMPGYYRDAAAVERALASDPLVYRVYMPKQPGEAIGFLAATSVIEPGDVGGEYYMTKGHFHLEQGAPEIYLTLRGRGLLLMQDRAGEVQAHEMGPGSLSFIPGAWAHRTVNTGDEPLVFFAVWPSDAGHDYESIQKTGFLRRVIAGPHGPQIVDA